VSTVVENIVILHRKREEHGSWNGDYDLVIVDLTDFVERHCRD
jgi:hypothetical protein